MEWQERVIQEHAELTIKIVKLRKFLTDTNKLTDLSQQDMERLQSQYVVMRQYKAILQQRIERF